VLLARGLEEAHPAADQSAGESRPDREARKDIHEDIAADAVPATRTSIGAVKGIATFFRNRGDVHAACLLFAVAADRISVVEGAEAASHELGIAAALARRHGRMRLAEALWRESLRRDPSNLRSSSSLGQLLHNQGRYREAANYLELPSGIDNYALLFLGWSLLLDGREVDDQLSTQRGKMSVTKALQNWSYQNRDASQREAWLRHVRRFARLQGMRDDTEALVTFANTNSGWPKIKESEVTTGSSAVTETAEAADHESPEAQTR
jgi:hypothetical protein